MTATVDSHRIGNSDSPARPTSTARRRLATAAVLLAAMIVGALGWRWALVEATTDYGPEPDALTGDPEVRPYVRHSPPPVELEVTVLDVHTAKAPFATRASAKSGAAEARVPTPAASAAKTRR
jgi:hypothetical protein